MVFLRNSRRNHQQGKAAVVAVDEELAAELHTSWHGKAESAESDKFFAVLAIGCCSKTWLSKLKQDSVQVKDKRTGNLVHRVSRVDFLKQNLASLSRNA